MRSWGRSQCFLLFLFLIEASAYAAGASFLEGQNAFLGYKSVCFINFSVFEASAYAAGAFFLDKMRYWIRNPFFIHLFIFEASAYAVSNLFFLDQMRLWGKHAIFIFFFCLKPVRTAQAFFVFR